MVRFAPDTSEMPEKNIEVAPVASKKEQNMISAIRAAGTKSGMGVIQPNGKYKIAVSLDPDLAERILVYARRCGIKYSVAIERVAAFGMNAVDEKK